MRQIILRWIGGLAVIPVTAGYVAVGVAVLTWRAVRDMAGAALPGLPWDADRETHAA